MAQVKRLAVLRNVKSITLFYPKNFTQGFMRVPHRHYKNIFFKASLFLMSLTVLCGGLSLCLLKSPSEKSNHYYKMAQGYQNQIENITDIDLQNVLLTRKQKLLEHAITVNPDHDQAWQALAITFAQLGVAGSAIEAGGIASSLGYKEPLVMLDKAYNLALSSEVPKKLASSDALFDLNIAY